MSTTTPEDPELSELRNATPQEKAAAFEWLRGQACDGEGIRHAAVLMVEIERLNEHALAHRIGFNKVLSQALVRAARTENAKDDARYRRWRELWLRDDELQVANVRDAERYRHWRELWLRDDDLEAMNGLGGNKGYSTPEQWDAILDDSMARKG